MAQNSLELKLPSRSSSPFYAKQKTLSLEGKKMDIKVDCPAPSLSSLWPISRIPCPSHLRDNYSEQPWRRTGPLKTVDFHIYAYFYLRFPWVSAAAAKSLQSCLTLCDPIDGSLPGSAVHGILQQLTNLTAAPSRLIKGDLFL